MTEINKHTIFITGAAGYVGAMLADQFSKRPDVGEVVALDMEPQPKILEKNPKIFWITANTSDDSWQEIARSKNPDIVIHTAWQIRELYGNRELEWKWNVGGSINIFNFAFETPEVKKLVHFSTVSSYGAFPENSTDHFFTEDEPFRKSEYLYAEEKRIVEEKLEETYRKRFGKLRVPEIAIIRPAAITGPRGRYARIRFGLQSALSGSLRQQGSFLYDFISLWVSWVPVTPKWLRQYVHEDDITDIVALLSFSPLKRGYEVLNAAPPGEAVFGKDMAEAVGKKTLPIQPWMVRLAFFWMWHLTRGRVPTAPGSWRGYSYPIAVDGSKISKEYGYSYKLESKDAFTKKEGRYAADALAQD
ncbi:MAG: NAD-dependent epimerase/dehydratase family protein [Candidatus Paceibacterota bacterium]|jgi:nucleoside-diphosphate-sugar epimerase